jgi:hypothetical protein
MMVSYVDVNGFRVHDLDDRSLPFALEEANFSSGPEPRNESEIRPSAHGSINRTRWYGPRIHELHGWCSDTDPLATARALADLRSVLALDGTTKTLRLRVLGDVADLTALVVQSSKFDAPVRGYQAKVRWGVTLEQPDPRYYRQPALSASGDPAAPAGLTCLNPGTFPTPAKITLKGPGRAISFDNRTTGQSIVFKGGITIAAGDLLVTDSATRTVTLNGVLQPWLIDASATTWFELAAGVNVVAVTGSQFTAASLLSAAWQEAQI